MGCRTKHFKTVCRHKWYVFKQCCGCGMPIMGLKHDLSKFSFAEFAPSARYFQGDKSPIEAEKASVGYSKAWLHHKGHNPHHWEWWCDFGKNGEVIPCKIPYKYVVEMVCDYIGAGMAYEKEDWNRMVPLRYYQKVRKGRHFHPETEELILFFLEKVATDGLVAFHRVARLKDTRTTYEARKSGKTPS